jgi:hypothetical protein
MSNHRILPLLLCVLLVPALLPATAGAASGTAGSGVSPAAAGITTNQARFGRGFTTRRSPSFGSRYRTRPRYSSRYRRPFGARHFFGGVLKTLGVLYLAHMLFGWGAGGGSPFGLLLFGAIVLFAVSRLRRRRALYY